jgi:hypothetical protein
VSEPPVLYLSSREVTNWATPRAVRLGRSPGHPELRWAELEPTDALGAPQSVVLRLATRGTAWARTSVRP